MTQTQRAVLGMPHLSWAPAASAAELPLQTATRREVCVHHISVCTCVSTCDLIVHLPFCIVCNVTLKEQFNVFGNTLVLFPTELESGRG